MKKFLILFGVFFLLSPLTVSSQEITSLATRNYLYRNVWNQIYLSDSSGFIVPDSITGKRIKVEIDSTGVIKIMPLRSNQDRKLIIHHDSIHDTVTFKVICLPDPELKYYTYYLNKSGTRSLDSIELDYSSLGLDYKCEVISFTFEIFSKGETIYKRTVKGNKFSDEDRARRLKTIRGDKIYISDVHYRVEFYEHSFNPRFLLLIGTGPGC